MPSPTTMPWPDNWCHNEHGIKCMVARCQFTSQSHGLTRQYDEMKAHCINNPSDAEHAIFLNMLKQRKCAFCSYRVTNGQSSSNKLRKLLAHERRDHGSDSMSRMCAYIVLAREGSIDGRLGQSTRMMAFDRMVEKLQRCQQPITHLLCQKSGFPHSLSNLHHILSTNALQPDRAPTPVWWPVAPEQFLAQLRPDDNDPGDYQWGRVWTRLRQMYSNGLL